MKTILIILVLAATGLYIYERRNTDLLRGQVALLENSLAIEQETVSKSSAEISALKEELRETEEALIGLVESLEVEVLEEVPVEEVREVSVRDNSGQINSLQSELNQREASWKQKRNEIDAEIARGRAAQANVSATQPNFNDGPRRTSDADRKRWHDNKQRQLAQIEHRLRELESEKSKLDLEWNSFRNEQTRKINALR
jgi:histone deacetylase complex regulatory component SIN3